MFSVLVSLGPILSAAEETKEPPSPGKVASAFFEALRAGSAEKALKLASDLKGLNAQPTIEAMAKEAKARPDAPPVKILDEKAIGDVAIVLVGEEGRRYRTGLDIDPVILARQDGDWKVLAAPIPPVALEAIVNAAADKEKTQEQLMQLGKWFAERKEAIYKEREMAAADK